MLTLDRFNKLNEAKSVPTGSGHTHYKEVEDLHNNFKKDYLIGKYSGTYVDYRTFPLYSYLNSKKTLPGLYKRFKTQKILFYYGLISQSFFRSSPSKHFDVWNVEKQIDDNTAIIKELTPMGSYRSFLYVKNKGIYQLSSTDSNMIPTEYKQYDIK
jgi:hypothetical protein